MTSRVMISPTFMAALPLVDRNDLSIQWPGVLTPRPDQATASKLLLNVRHVPCRTSCGEDRRKQVNRNAQGVVQPRRIVVYVRIEPEALGGHGSDFLLDLRDP